MDKEPQPLTDMNPRQDRHDTTQAEATPASGQADDRDRHHNYRITWSDEDGEYVGLCDEFPGLSWLDGSPEAALDGIRRAVREAEADMAATRERDIQDGADDDPFYSAQNMARLRRAAAELEQGHATAHDLIEE